MPPEPEDTTRVTLSFDRHLTDEEINQIKADTNAIEALAVAASHHHDHDSKAF